MTHSTGLAGIGWRQPHYQQLLQERPPLAFLEVHSENFFADGGAALDVLQQGREVYPLSLHGVGLGLGSAVGLDHWHLERLARLVDRIQPLRISDHACFARAPIVATLPAGAARHGSDQLTLLNGSDQLTLLNASDLLPDMHVSDQPTQLHGSDPLAVVHGSDLLPVAFTQAALHIMASNVLRVQDRLKRPILVENLSAYLHWADDTLTEPEFFNQLARRTGCAMLLDVNNLVVNALNAGQNALAAACRFIDAIDVGIVGEIHLAGFSEASGLVIDDHSSRVHAPVWQAFAHAVARFGAVPTLIEWDTDLPSLEVLLGEAGQAQAVFDELAARPQAA